MNWLTRLQDVLSGKAPKGQKRSPLWPKTRSEYMKAHPRCALCGGTKKLNVHHKKPFWLFPELELDPENLMTLCEGSKQVNCHLVVGHLFFYKSFNPNLTRDVLIWRAKILNRP